MTPTEYQKACLRTASPVSRATNDNLRMQGAMGLCGETAELMQAVRSGLEDEKDTWKHEIAEELGDVLWYAATTASSIGEDLGDLIALNTYWSAVQEPTTPMSFANIKYRMECEAVDMMLMAGAIIDSVKKETFQGHPADFATVAVGTTAIVHFASKLAGFLRLSLEDVADANIEKLRARYPEGFEKARSIVRE